jgi:hypothetical protein
MVRRVVLLTGWYCRCGRALEEPEAEDMARQERRNGVVVVAAEQEQQQRQQ